MNVCKGTNCTAVDGIGHSAECMAEHNAICEEAARQDHAWGDWLDGRGQSQEHFQYKGCRCVQVEITESESDERTGERRRSTRGSFSHPQRRDRTTNRRWRVGSRNDRKDKK